MPGKTSRWRAGLLTAAATVLSFGLVLAQGPGGPTLAPPTLGPTIPVIPAPRPVPQPEPRPAMPVQPPEGRFECPRTYVDCMPPVNSTNRPLCTTEYLDWAKAHCPNLQIVY